MEENKKPTVLIVLLILAGLCLVGLGIWSGIKSFKGKDETQEEMSSEIVNVVDYSNKITCRDGDSETISNVNAVDKLEYGTAWTDGGISIYYSLNDSILNYYIDGEDNSGKYKTELKQLDNYTCNNLFELHTRHSNDSHAEVAGICLSENGKLYEIGLTIKANADDSNGYKLTDFIPHIEEVTQYCKID